MTKEKEKAALQALESGWDLLCNQARIIAMLPLEEWLEGINSAETIGPIMDPTLFIQASRKMTLIKGIIEAALVLKRAVIKLQPELKKEIEKTKT